MAGPDMNLSPALPQGGGGGGDVRLNPVLPGGGGGGAINPATDVTAPPCCCHGGRPLEGGGGGTGATGEGGHCSDGGSGCCVTGATGGRDGITNSTTDNSHLYTITRFAADRSNACASVNYYAATKLQES